ncbi:MAG: hypothetical protein JWO56_2904, partial [Acidobacteria bacterium]|nr:hypothetical protein [Acidobacteriota bacterium]
MCPLKRFSFVALSILFAGILFAFLGCGRASAERPLPLAGPQLKRAPLRVAVFVDQTLSIGEARIAPLTEATLQPLLARVQISGGELAIGRIRDRSDAPLARVYIPEPPAMPPAAPAPANTNIFAKAALKKREAADRARDAVVAEASRKDSEAAIAAFHSDVAPLLAAEDDAPSTDIRSALLRASLFAAEPTQFRGQPRTIAIFLTDGLDTVNRLETPRMAAGTEIILVNGVGSIG